jgi:hypothetical protein
MHPHIEKSRRVGEAEIMVVVTRVSVAGLMCGSRAGCGRLDAMYWRFMVMSVALKIMRIFSVA